MIRPGDYVDVIGNLPGENGGPQQSVVLLQRVLVLAVGLETAPQALVDKNGSDSARNRDMVLTLSVDLQQTQLLSLAIEKGRLTVALRNPDDQRIVEGIPDMSSTALTKDDIRKQIQKAHVGPVRLETKE
jgi:pilus assembly protein CpaB